MNNLARKLILAALKRRLRAVRRDMHEAFLDLDEAVHLVYRTGLAELADNAEARWTELVNEEVDVREQIRKVEDSLVTKVRGVR